MNGLLSSASPWHNDSVTNNSTSKKRTPSLTLPRNKTIKNNKPNKTDSLELSEDHYIEDHKESFQNIPSSTIPNGQNTIETIQPRKRNR